MRRTNMNGVEFPEFPEIPATEEELEAQIKEMADKDESADAIFKNAEYAAELNSLHCNFGHKIACLTLVKNEMFDSTRQLWKAVFTANNMIKALEAATASTDNITSGITDNIVKAQQTPIPVKISIEDADVKLLNEQREKWVKEQKQFLGDLKAESAKATNAVWQIMHDGQGFWMQGKYVKWMILIFVVSVSCTLTCAVVGLAKLYEWMNL